ncbi:MAG TPA: cobalt-precorrin-5B (C(1))-methyltransferase [Methanoregulaceae archaeon]|nr:cobalt-precorrin-5B (C(1))-methyltransferase [Methanoregulaceae archaeon]
MRDPVTGFEYPPAWVAACTSPGELDMVRQGLAVLTASGRVLRRGYTTGTTAAAACKAAILSLAHPVHSVTVTIPCGLTLDIPVFAGTGKAECRKYAGDYPEDATAGAVFVARAEEQEEGISLECGEGIGRFARATPRFSKGTPAITPAPLSCIMRSMEEALAEVSCTGVRVLLEVPGGEAVAARTLNARVGVKGGISILGTTGLVEPWDDHLAESAFARIAGSERIVLTTGRIGLRYARLRYPDHEVVLIGSRIREGIAAARGDAVLFGLPALILKYIRPDILEGTGYATVEELSAASCFGDLVKNILQEFTATHPRVRVVLIDRNGRILGESP